MSARPSASELLQTPGALLQRKHFRELGLERRAIDAIYRHCRVVYMPDYSHGMVRVEDYLAFLAGHTFCDGCGDRVVPG